ncbi:hypothetical protein GCM10017786_01300 [Amycolatopsis deserti]|uniref:SnoaL-like domain-containing protein n=1 Tax=Amycolatopsis deserti TaxID=185696 RepID=A0ABQ3IE17_9PSEU|nr:limonene-1,2-epoxide hydrolase family protein [Amycolatopsis deserti]GHE76130.1 hypothetical protein GCM10017786_01300 [Amycolatopsis deserti]
MGELSKKEMEEILLEHEIAELEEDVERTMATLVDEPQYELPTLGFAIRGADAVRETYRRIMRRVVSRDVAAEMRVHAIAANTLIREACVSFNLADGRRVTGTYSVIMSFDAEKKKITGERMYMDTNFAAYMTEQLGDDFADVPGVTALGDVLPNIERHDAFAVAERKGKTINRPTVDV